MDLLLSVLSIAVIVTSGYCRPLTEDNSLWEPKGRSRADWLDCRGLDCAEWAEAQELKNKLTLLDTLQETKPSHMDVVELTLAEPLSTEDFDDVLYTPEDMQEMLQERTGERVKRKVTNNADRKWKDARIIYKFDGEHSAVERDSIRTAIAEWEAETCARFIEKPTGEEVQEPHILFTKAGFGCASYIGRLAREAGTPQEVNLDAKCFAKPGVATHEIGHALGLWHEHQRPIRDDYLKVNTESVPRSYLSNFDAWKASWNLDFGIPYDYNSVMHYGSKVGSFFGHTTLEPRDPRYLRNIGQRVRMSFLDAMAVNKLYCEDRCPRPIACQNGGYQDPNSCGQCKCPDGLGGDLCQHVETSSDGRCGGDIVLTPGEVQEISTPGYDAGEGYESGLSCNWRIKVPSNEHVRLTFLDPFNVTIERYNEICHHWAEVKLHADLAVPGPRFCGTERPEDVISEKDVMVVSFRAIHPIQKNGRGFKAIVSVDGAKPKTEPTTTTTTTTTTPNPAITTTTTAPPTTTTTTTTTTQTPRDTKEWSEWTKCSGSCECGGCRMQSRHTLCNGQKCEGADVEIRPCEQRVCTSSDTELTFTGKFYLRACSECCSGFRREGDQCVLA